MMKIVNNRIDFLNEVKTLLPDNPTCIELGVEKGDFSKLLIQYLTPKKLFLVDPWQTGHDKNSEPNYGTVLNSLPTAYSTEQDYVSILNHFYKDIKSNKVIVRPDFSYNVVDDFPDNYFDFIYIDSCHLYDSVKADLNDFLPKLKVDGIMAGHDYFNYDNFGVIKAVDEFCIEHGFEKIVMAQPSWDWALRKNKS